MAGSSHLHTTGFFGLRFLQIVSRIMRISKERLFLLKKEQSRQCEEQVLET